MTSKHYFVFFIIVVLMHCLLSPGLGEGTKIATPSGMISIELLAIDDVITSAVPVDHAFPAVPIRSINSHISDDGYLIQTDQSVISASSDQLFYECKTNTFTAAENFQVGDCLLGKDGLPHECIRIERNTRPTRYYELSLDAPHLFFSSDAIIVTHNMGTLLPSYISAARALVGAIIACVHANRQPELFTDFEKGRNQIQNQVLKFGDDFEYKTVSKLTPLGCPRISRPMLFGMHISESMYADMMHRPWFHGPVCAVATLTEDGEIKCVLNSWDFTRTDRDSNFFDWHELGKTIFKCNEPLVKHFVAFENKKQCAELRNIVNKWPVRLRELFAVSEDDVQQEAAHLRSQTINLERMYYKTWFGARALYRMIQYEISPLLVVHTIRHGTCTQPYCPNRLLYLDTGLDTAIVTEKQTHKVLDVGHCADIAVLNPDPKKKDPEEEATIIVFDDFMPVDLYGQQVFVQQGGRSIDTILNDCQYHRPTKTKKNTPDEKTTQQYLKYGDYDTALLDFYSTGVQNVRDIPNGKIGNLPPPDGRTILARRTSTFSEEDDEAKAPSLEIQKKLACGKKEFIKVRYFQ